MEYLHKFSLEHKEDIWKIPPETRILKVNCKLNLHFAKRIVEHCRELEKVIFSPHAFEISDKSAVNFLRPFVFVEILGRESDIKVDKKTAKRIKELWARGDHNLQNLSQKFKVPVDTVYHIIHEKATEVAKEEKYD